MKNAAKQFQGGQITMQGMPALKNRERQQDSTWLYVRIYCQMAEADEVLLHLVAPLERALREQGLISSFFFIRYFEGGHHLRTRFCGEKSVLLGVVRDTINQHIARYFTEQGFSLEDPLDWGPDGMDDLQWQALYSTDAPRPIPSYEYDRYEPETTRYGGQQGLLVSEQHFAWGSKMACSVLEWEKNGIGSRRNAALLLLDALTQGFHFTDQQKATSFEQQYRYWMSSSWCTPKHLELFDQEYKRQCPVLQLLIPLHAHAPIHRSRMVWLPLIEQWQEMASNTYNALTQLQEQGQLTVYPVELMFSYIHMFCNRLKLFPREEAYLSYLLYRNYSEQLAMIG